jgi:hypothetical protein
VRERRPIQVVCRMHELVAERGGRVADQGHVITELHGEAAGGLNARVGEQADGDDMRDAVLLELKIEVRIGEAALRPVLRNLDAIRPPSFLLRRSAALPPTAGMDSDDPSLRNRPAPIGDGERRRP